MGFNTNIVNMRLKLLSEVMLINQIYYSEVNII